MRAMRSNIRSKKSCNTGITLDVLKGKIETLGSCICLYMSRYGIKPNPKYPFLIATVPINDILRPCPAKSRQHGYARQYRCVTRQKLEREFWKTVFMLVLEKQKAKSKVVVNCESGSSREGKVAS